MNVSFASWCRQFQPRSFSRKVFRIFGLYPFLVKEGPELTLVPGPDCSLNGSGGNAATFSPIVVAVDSLRMQNW